MKITDTVQSMAASKELLPKKADGSEALPAAPPTVKPGTDAFNVHLTDIATRIHEPSTPDEISHDKVAAIRDQLAAGTYSISGKDVAKKILGALKG